MTIIRHCSDAEDIMASTGTKACGYFSLLSMLRKSIVIIATILFLNGLASYATQANCPSVPVVDGVADLRCWDGQKSISLRGGWHLDYQAHYEEKSYQGIAAVPMRWREMTPALPFAGRGVYRLTILLPEPMDQLALKLPFDYLAKKAVLIDDSGNEILLFDNGKTAQAEDVVVEMRMPIIPMPRMGVKSELVLYANNSLTLNGGMQIAPILGAADELMRSDQVLMNSTTVISTILIVFFALNLYLWWTRDKNLSLLSLALATLILSIRQVAAAGVLYEYLPNLSIVVDGYIGWGTYFLGMAAGLTFVRATYPDLVPKWLANLVYVSVILGLLVMVSQPHHIMQILGKYFHLVSLLSILVMIWHFFRGMHGANEEIRLTMLSGAALLTGFASDIIYFYMIGFNPPIPLTAIGMMVFVGTQSIVISRRYSESLRRSAELSQELHTLNVSLEEKVARRTAELAVKNQQLEEMARTDALTGLSNRHAFEEIAKHEVARSKRSGVGFVIGIIDLDLFKSKNDTYGHEVGDQILQRVGRILREGLRAGDYPFRWGGDEFCVLFPETEGDVTLVIAERLRQMIEAEVYSIDDEDLTVTASFGLADWKPDQEVDDVISQADQAMYESKRSGSNKVTAWWHMPRSSQSLDRSA